MCLAMLAVTCSRRTTPRTLTPIHGKRAEIKFLNPPVCAGVSATVDPDLKRAKPHKDILGVTATGHAANVGADAVSRTLVGTDPDPARDGRCLTPVMGHQDEGLTQRVQDTPYPQLYLGPRPGIQGRHQLVRQKRLGFADQHPGRRYPLLLFRRTSRVHDGSRFES